LTSLVEMEARIKEFDEQPLGEHIRPHLLRASSLPLTVLLRQESESTDDRSSIRSSRDHLGGRNTSCEDLFFSDSPRPKDCSGLLRRLTEALERVGELEMEVRVIPELRAQICILQEERERLRLGLVHHIPPLTVNGTTELCHSSPYSKGDVIKSQQESHIMFPRNHTQNKINPTHDWKASTDLDELLTVTSLQAKVAALEQKLHDTEQDLQRMVGLLKDQQQDSRRKDGKIEYLIRNPGVWVRAEKVVVDQEEDETVVRSTEPHYNPASSFISTRTNWFGAAAEETSEACRVAAYLKDVKREAPSLLAFLVNLADDNGNTVLHYSVSHCNYGIVGLLLDTGVSDANVQNKAGYTAVMLASLTAPDGPAGMEVVRKLMELGDVNIRSSQTGQTALHLAVRHGRVVMVRLLLSCGANANIQDNQGMTSLMFASKRGHTHIARLLLERSPCDLSLTDKRIASESDFLLLFGVTSHDMSSTHGRHQLGSPARHYPKLSAQITAASVGGQLATESTVQYVGESVSHGTMNGCIFSWRAALHAACVCRGRMHLVPVLAGGTEGI
ncbi:hypothetical protein GOODEAATRI_014617, partial [Goodea atripinnis]